MKALSIKQPWIYCILYEGKNIENRNWLFSERMVGERIALHASQGIDRDGFYLLGYSLNLDSYPDGQFKTGEILGTAVLDGYVTKSESKWFFGEYGWLLRDIQILSTPIPCKGKLGLWQVIPPIEKQIREQTSS